MVFDSMIMLAIVLLWLAWLLITDEPTQQDWDDEADAVFGSKGPRE